MLLHHDRNIFWFTGVANRLKFNILQGGFSMGERTQYSSGSISGLAGRVGLERVLIIAGVLIGWLIGTDPSAVRQHLPSDPGCLDLFNGLPAALNPGTAL